MYEVTGNFHVHTVYSDGSGTHEQVAQAAARAGLDVLAFTDHNVWTSHHTGWYVCPSTGRKVLLLMGEEVNDESLPTSINHYLCLGADQEVHRYSRQPQEVIDACSRHGGAGFLAHPIDRPAPILPEQTSYPWLDWTVSGYTGIEVWNYGSDFKSRLSSLPAALVASYLPGLYVRGPFPESLALWDRLTATGQQVVGIGTSDAHADVIQLGPIRRQVFTYEYLFKTVNTCLLLDAPLADDYAGARQQVLGALGSGHAFVAYGPAGSARGFRFTAIASQRRACMGDEVQMEDGLMLQVRVPGQAIIRLLKDGREVGRTRGRRLEYLVSEAGVYRAEVRRVGRMIGATGWILPNPIYVRDS